MIAANCPDPTNGPCDPYWHHINLAYLQIEGIQDMYTKLSDEDKLYPHINREDIFFINIFHDMEELSQAVVKNNKLNVTVNRTLGSGSCSALIKLTPGAKDLFTSHVTWTGYQRLLRIMKKYDFSFKDSGSLNPGKLTAFSGYPGQIFSGDDFTLMSPSKLTSMETTIGNSNDDLWQYIVPQGSVLSGFRATVANWLADSGWEWTDIFARYNSGTYNNEWMVVDYKLFKPNQYIDGTKGLLYVLDQLPGMVHVQDMTGELAMNSYFASYNVPVFSDIFDMNGSPALVEQYGDWFTHDKNPRSQIFNREQRRIETIDDMARTMRWNKYQTDPLSACDCTPPYSGENAISARSDLNPANGTFPFGALKRRLHGGTDMKLVTSSLIENLQMKAVSGPTSDDQPPFEWNKSGFEDVPHFGLPNKWDFKPLVYQWKLSQ